MADIISPGMTHRFLVTAGGAGGGFRAVPSMRIETQNIQMRDGSSPLQVRNIIGQGGGGSITLAKGVGNGGLVSWKKEVSKAAGSPGGGGGFRRTAVVQVLRSDASVADAYRFGKAWPTVLEVSGLDAMTAGVAVDQLTLVFDEFG